MKILNNRQATTFKTESQEFILDSFFVVNSKSKNYFFLLTKYTPKRITNPAKN
jgi:hypothetical protein